MPDPTTQQIRRLISEELEPIRTLLQTVERVLLEGDKNLGTQSISRRVASLEAEQTKSESERRRIEAKFDRWVARLSWIGVGASITLIILGSIAGTFGVQALSQVLEVLDEVRKQLPK